MENKSNDAPDHESGAQQDPKKHISGEDQDNDINKEDEEFPGYPHYPAGEDILSPKNRMNKVSTEDENLTRSGQYLDKTGSSKTSTDVISQRLETNEDDLGIVPGTEADVTKEDLLLLGEDEYAPVGAGLADDLDIPGAELDDENEAIGEEDEENNYYSLGGDRHENLEENPS